MSHFPCAPTSEASDIRPSAPTAEADLTLLVRYGLVGNTVIQLTPDMLEWADDAEQALEVIDILEMLGVPRGDECLYDLLAEGASEVWNEFLPLQWGQSYVQHKRTCARCTMCSQACTRQHTDHRLCAHGDTNHL